MLVLLVRDDLVAAEDDEVSLVVDLFSVLGLRGHHKVVGVGGPLNQPLQGQQAAGLAFRLLAVHLLEAEDVGLEPEELGSHHRDPLGEGRLFAGLVVEVFQVEGCYAKVVQDNTYLTIWDFV